MSLAWTRLSCLRVLLEKVTFPCPIIYCFDKKAQASSFKKTLWTCVYPFSTTLYLAKTKSFNTNAVYLKPCTLRFGELSWFFKPKTWTPKGFQVNNKSTRTAILKCHVTNKSVETDSKYVKAERQQCWESWSDCILG